MLTYLSLRVGQTLAGKASPKTLRAMARMFSDLQYLGSTHSRAVVRENVSTVLGSAGTDEEVEKITRQVFRSFGRYLMDFLSLGRYTNDELRDRIQILHPSRLKEMGDRKTGAVLLSGHFANWELSAMTIALAGYPVTAVTQFHQDPSVNDLFMRLRGQRGVQYVNMDTGIKACFKTLMRQEHVAVAADWIQPGNGIPVQIFGRTVHFPLGPAGLAVRFGVPVLPGVFAYDGDDRPSLEICEPFFPPDQGSQEERIHALSVDLARWLESTIRTHLSQWCMFRRIWSE